MIDWKKLFRSLLYPHIAIMIVLIPIATVFLIVSMVIIGSESIPAYISYVLAAYTLTIWCMRIPRIVAWIKHFKAENRYVRRWFEDTRLQVNVALYGSLLWNTAYALFQLGLGIYHASLWFYSMAAYYLFLAVMRFLLVRHSSRHRPGEQMRSELLRYRACGWIFLFMNLSLSVVVFFMVYLGRTFEHHEITTIAMAAYTFTAFTVALVNLIRYKKFNSPVFSASKAISLAAACVSMLTLSSTMLTTFGAGEDPMFQRLMLGLIGGGVSAFIITMAIYMIVRSTKKIHSLETETTNERSET